MRLLRYLWAAPATLIGLIAAAVGVVFGATARRRSGVLEVAGGRLAAPVERHSWVIAITFGHVVLGIDHDTLDRERAHEHAHVRQYERWGVLFFPLYLLSSAAQRLRGRHAYWENAFEREARAIAAVESNVTTA